MSIFSHDYSHSVFVSVLKQLYLWAMSHFELAHIPFCSSLGFVFIFDYVYMCVWICVCIPSVFQYSQRPQKGIGSFEPEVRGDCEPSPAYCDLNLGSLETLQALLFTNSSLQPQFSFWQCILIIFLNISSFSIIIGCLESSRIFVCPATSLWSPYLFSKEWYQRPISEIYMCYLLLGCFHLDCFNKQN